MSRLPDETSFLKDVAHHKMTVLRDDGLYRHLRFQQPGTGNLWFDVTTWPNYLCFSGDAGCYVFSRIPDMIAFFRRHENDKAKVPVNLYYWPQKLEAVDRSSGIEEFSPDKFRAAITAWLDDVEASPELREAVADEVLAYADDGEHEAMRAAMEFEHGKSPTFRFHDFYESDVKEFTYRLIWCCFALSWAVQQYDAHTAAVQSRWHQVALRPFVKFAGWIKSLSIQGAQA